ncbi:hypothetical protein KY285_001891 [Solanum tuberosum]|nr:hypothetical protein KY284_002047 [Solanum tuberosum]KAH0766020.1 hypothetical protein KY285_001891 [Solanum tuberosum]
MVEIVDLGAIENDRDGCGDDVGHDEFVGGVLLDYDDTVRGPPLREKASLDGSNDSREVGLSSIGNDIGNNFVTSITQANRPEVLQCSSILTFKD